MEKPGIVETEGFILAGMHQDMTLNDDRTTVLWQQFMPRRQSVPLQTGHDLYSVQVYPEDYDMNEFTNDTVFTKWAAVRVASAEKLPEGIDLLTVPAGKYAVFTHRGTAAAFGRTAGYIFGEWLPASGYSLDSRPHLDVMGRNYHGHLDPRSEEDIWIPVR